MTGLSLNELLELPNDGEPVVPGIRYWRLTVQGCEICQDSRIAAINVSIA